MDWVNKNNTCFYENVEVDDFKSVASKGGLTNCPDMEILYPMISNSKNLLDAGAGYGRAINYLIEKKFQGSIMAVERSRNFCKHLNNLYGDRIEVICSDIEDLRINLKFDVILFLWSNISEWPPGQQQSIIKLLKNLLTQSGNLVIEVINSSLEPLNADKYDNQYYFADTPFGTVSGYNPSTKEVINYLKNEGLNLNKHILYLTDKNRKREIFIASHNLNITDPNTPS